MRHDRSVKARRDTALARNELRPSGEFFFEADAASPADGRHCEAMASDGIGNPYSLPFPVYRKDGAWLNANFDRLLRVKIVKWRYA